MDISHRGYNFKQIIIKKNRHFFFCIYPYKYSEELKRHKIICHSYFVDRLKPYDLDFVLNQVQVEEIERFLQENTEFDFENTIFYTLMELEKGLSFSPDIRTQKLFYSVKFRLEESKGIVYGQILGLLPKLYNKLMNIISNSFFGMRKGEGYDYSDNYDEILKKIDGFKTIITKDKLPDFVRQEVL